MSEKLFWVNPYQTELNSRVTNVDGNKVELDQTIFFVESGGQESD
ncbi:MAG: alanyl-tRNA editing protein, partial [Vibrio alginolyticus]